MRARASITVRRPREEVHRRFVELERQAGGATRFGPIEVLEEEVGRRIGFKSAEDADTQATGVVVFTDAPGDRGTEIHLDLEYGTLGGALKKATGDEPLQQAKDDLRRFRQIVETGEILRSDGTPEGHSAKRHLGQREAQPLPDNA